MKHILNNLTEEEKNSIRKQHTGGMKVMTENFNKLINSKLGDSKPLVKESHHSNDLDDNTIREALQGAVSSADPKDFSDEFEYADNIISYAVEKIMDEFGDVDEFEITDHIKDKYGDNLLDIYNNSLDN